MRRKKKKKKKKAELQLLKAKRHDVNKFRKIKKRKEILKKENGRKYQEVRCIGMGIEGSGQIGRSRIGDLSNGVG